MSDSVEVSIGIQGWANRPVSKNSLSGGDCVGEKTENKKADMNKKLFLQFMLKSILLVFSSTSFTVYGLIFRFLIHFEFVYVMLEDILILFIYM